MARLIDADALIEEALTEGAYGYVDAKQIADAPTVNAVAVVRCKDCKHWNIHKGNDPTQLYFCNFDNLWSKPCRAPYDFCSHGERKDGDSNG